MPSVRFHNLKPIKKRIFLRMAYKEFALHSYEGASITKLVLDLKMAKGSIYQYFDDKEDLYHYLVDHAYEQLHNILTKACPTSNKFDTWYKNYLLVYIKFLCAIPAYAFLMIKHKTEFAETGSENQSLVSQLISQTSKDRLSKETFYFLNTLPFTIFNFIIESQQVDSKELVKSSDSLDISNNKLLYLCEAFLTNAEFKSQMQLLS